MKTFRLATFTLLIFFFFNGYSQTTITSFSPSSGPVGSLVTIIGTNLSNATSLTIGGTAAIVVSNSNTQVVGMVMPGTVTGSVSITAASSTTSSSTNFSVVKLSVTNTQKLIGSDTSGFPLQGVSVALSADGSTAIVGGPNNSLYGAVWVYIRTGSNWVQQGPKLTASDIAGQPNFGSAVALSADGNTASIGGINDANGRGAVWIFTRSNGMWTQQGIKLVGSDFVGTSQQGNSVAISADGNTVVSGGYNDNKNKGATWVFIRNNGTWTQQGLKLVGTGNVGDAYQGYSVGISADGNTLIATGIFDNNNTGASWVFVRSGNVWAQQGNKLVGTGFVGIPLQGTSVALSADGNSAIVGGYFDNNNLGASWVFTRSDTMWSQQGNKLVGTGSQGNSQQGFAVSITADGNSAMIGGPQDNSNNGASWIFSRSNEVWTQKGNKFVATGNIGPAQQGYSTGLSADGNTSIVGGYVDNKNQGAAWVFTGANAALPLTLLSFNATLENKNVELSWRTSNEVNTDKFIIQRSMDGSSFTTIKTISASLESSSTKNYSAIDADISATANKLYYRLQMVDHDGSFSYSNVEVVAIPHSERFSISPNPAHDYFTLTGPDIEQIQVLDLSGRIVLNKVLKTQREKISIHMLTKGIYIVKAFDFKGIIHSKKLVVE